jgi:hypothetical protein
MTECADVMCTSGSMKNESRALMFSVVEKLRTGLSRRGPKASELAELAVT